MRNKLHITCSPADPHFNEFLNDPDVSGIRMNGLLFKASNLAEHYAKIPVHLREPSAKLLWLDAKGRQLRVEEAEYFPDHLELVMNHTINLPTPHSIIFKAGEDWATVEKVDGRRLILRGDGFPKYRVRPGDSVHFRDSNVRITDSLFTADEKEKILQAVKLGFKNFYLSYVESERDVQEFQELVGRDANLILKIENQRGLEYVAKSFETYHRSCGNDHGNIRLACARGDLYVEVEKPHHILDAQKLIIEKDKRAIVGSRLLLSLFKSTVPACSDVNELGLLSQMGYRNFLLCDDLCKNGPALHRAVDTFVGILP